MLSFSFSTTRTLLNEPGGAKRLAAICKSQGARSVLIVTDPGIRKVGLLEAVLPGFAQEAVAVAVFDETEPDPAESTVLKAAQLGKQHQIDLVVGFGGGSSMDVAKLVALLASPDCTQSLADMYGVDRASGRRLGLIQVPTTAGTGSEVTPISIITTGATTKAGVVSPLLQPDMALLDAELTLNLPPQVTAATGIDAMVHAIEAYTTRHKKNPVSDLLAKEALRLLSGNLRKAVQDGQNIEVRSNMLLGAMLAGQAFANAPVAAVHALAYPLGGHYHIPHGLSNSLVLPHVMRFNAPNAQHLYAELAPIIMGNTYKTVSTAKATTQLIDYLEDLIMEVGLPARLRDCKVPESALEQLAKEAMLQQRLLINNPRDVSEQDALEIYRAAF